MWFVTIGTILVALKWLEIDPVAQWSWLWILTPFALAMAWWAWADATGYTRRKAMARDDAKRDQRRRRQFEALGLDYRAAAKTSKRPNAYQRFRQTRTDDIEGGREKQREHQKEVIAHSRFTESEMDSSQPPDAEAPRKR